MKKFDYPIDPHVFLRIFLDFPVLQRSYLKISLSYRANIKNEICYNGQNVTLTVWDMISCILPIQFYVHTSFAIPPNPIVLPNSRRRTLPITSH